MTKCKNACPEGKFDGCCAECPHSDACADLCHESPSTCEDAVFDEAELEAFKIKSVPLLQKIVKLVMKKAEIEVEEREIREKLRKLMDAHGIDKFDNDAIKVTYVQASKKTSIDSKKLKDRMPDIYEKFSKTSDVKAHVKIELKTETPSETEPLEG
jgi:hypothetical protein